MTVHRLARVVRRAHARAKEQGAKDERWLAELLDDLQDWDEALVERRGRCPAASATTVD